MPARRSFLQSVGAGLFAMSIPKKAVGAGYRRPTGETRRFRAYRVETGERLDAIYWVDGSYLQEALKAINYFCRDVDTRKIHSIDPRIIDISTAMYNLLDVDGAMRLHRGFVDHPFDVSNGKNPEPWPNGSFHANGTALDVSFDNRSAKQIFLAAIKCRGGGVGRYSMRNYVHIDCNQVRKWDG